MDKITKMDLIRVIRDKTRSVIDRPFLAPIFFREQPREHVISVRIDGLKLSLRAARYGRVLDGHDTRLLWWTTKDLKYALALAMAQQYEIVEYLSLFPRVRVLVLAVDHDMLGYWASYSRPSDVDLGMGNSSDPYYVHCIEPADRLSIFDETICRFDGTTIIHDRIVYEDWNALETANKLRRHLGKWVKPTTVRMNYSRSYAHAYEILFTNLQNAEKKTERQVIEDAVSHAGGILDSYETIGDTFNVYYSINGVSHRSSVNRELQGISTQGVCLAGEDSIFDLHSLVSVVARWDQGER